MMTRVTTKQNFLIAFLILGSLFLSGCRAEQIRNVPSDFLFVMDVKSAGNFDGCTINVNIRIEANGKGRYQTYDTNCVVEYDLNHMVTYQQGQIIDKGQFNLNHTELEGLWNAINQNNFFSLTEDYRMAIGLSYAFIVIEADGQRHMVDNIGLEVPEVRAIVEATDSIMPKEVHLNYGREAVP